MSRTSRGDAILDRLRAMPANVWRACPGCGALLHAGRLRSRHGICPECGGYFRLSAHERIALLVDPGRFVELYTDLRPVDALEFVDRLPYPERVDRAQQATGLGDAAVAGTAEIGGCPVALVVMEFAFLGGSMGVVVGEKVSAAAEYAREHRIPLVTVASSGGARMQEGILSLLQMAKTAAAVRLLREAGVPFLSVLTDPVYGGVAASFAGLGDVVVAEAGTRAGFAGPQVIAQTMRQRLTPGFQTAEFLSEHGHIDLVVSRAELRATVSRIVGTFAAAGRRPEPAAEVAPPARSGATVGAWAAVRLARTPGRPTAREYIGRMFTDFVELHGDRWSADDAAVVGGFAWLDGAPLMVVGTCKGTDTAENVRRNFGMPHPAGYRKTIRLLSLAERIGLPVVTLVDTPGAYPGAAAEEQNQSAAIAETLARAAGLRVPTVCAVTGEGGSGGALALAVGDRLLVQENAIVSVISPEGCATILFGDATRAPEAADALRLRSDDLYELGVVDEIVPEPPGGAHAEPEEASRVLRAALRRHLCELLTVPVDRLVADRYRRLRSYGRARSLVPAAAVKEMAHG